MIDVSSASPPADASAVQALIRVSRILEKATTELSLSDFRVLSAVHAGEERASRVAARLSIGRPSISATVDSLCRRGFLVRGEVDHDQRADSLRVTAAGAAVRDRVERELSRVVTRLSVRSGHPDEIIRALAWLGDALESEMREHAAGPTSAAVRSNAESTARNRAEATVRSDAEAPIRNDAPATVTSDAEATVRSDAEATVRIAVGVPTEGAAAHA